MSARTMVLPVEFVPNSANPKEPAFYEAVQKFCEAEFGARASLHTTAKTWAAFRGDGAGGYDVRGLTSLSYAVDCHRFHIKAGGDDPAEREDARTTREMLMARASSFIQDFVGAGTETLVYVSPGQERFWKGYLRLIGAESANRWIVKV